MTTRLPAFEVLVDMARNDPEGLETLRRSLTSAVIASARSANSRRRLQGLQFKVDVERRRAATPLAATIRISEMMCRSLADLHASLVTPADEEPGHMRSCGESANCRHRPRGLRPDDTPTTMSFPFREQAVRRAVNDSAPCAAGQSPQEHLARQRSTR